METELAVFTLRAAPGRKSGEWHQRGLHRALTNWRSEKPDWYDVLISDSKASVAVGYYIHSDDVGDNGHRTSYCFRPDLDPQFIDREDSQNICLAFFNIWTQKIAEVIEEEQQKTLFSPKEFATLFGYRNPFMKEAEVADALHITVGTYRGKLGRVKQKLQTAKHTLGTDEAIDSIKPDDWSGDGYSAPLSVIMRVDESRLPINSVHSSAHSSVDIDDIPLEDLLLE